MNWRETKEKRTKSKANEMARKSIPYVFGSPHNTRIPLQPDIHTRQNWIGGFHNPEPHPHVQFHPPQEQYQQCRKDAEFLRCLPPSFHGGGRRHFGFGGRGQGLGTTRAIERFDEGAVSHDTGFTLNRRSRLGTTDRDPAQGSVEAFAGCSVAPSGCFHGLAFRWDGSAIEGPASYLPRDGLSTRCRFALIALPDADTGAVPHSQPRGFSDGGFDRGIGCGIYPGSPPCFTRGAGIFGGSIAIVCGAE
mmetsp:Transcript_15201/g.18507  ORF Transcript_15201/g.18507 Transcript_15201/m.18507 type:complete len:248 (+) Transcript_15201:1396-2139(+)